MKNLFAWASIGENGRGTGGKKGDQTGEEVKVGNYYDFGQNKVIRFKNPLRGRKMAEIAKFVANDNSVGYNMSVNERATFYNACRAYNWNWVEVKRAISNGAFPKCNTDCSDFYLTCVNLTYGYCKIPPTATTMSLVKICTEQNKRNFKLTPNFPPKKWKKGDAPIKEGKHIIINV